MKQTAKDTIGTTKPVKRKTTRYSDKIAQLSEKQKDIHKKIQNTKNNEQIVILKHNRNQILKEIKREQKNLLNKEVDDITNEIANAKHDHQFFKAIKHLRNPRKNNKMIIHNQEGQSITNPDEQYRIVKKHFQEQFYDPNKKPVEKFTGQTRQLNNRITEEEVRQVTRRMNNNKAAGNDQIPTELLKYGPAILHKETANCLNKALEQHEDNLDLGTSILLPTQKPKKKEGPTKNLRPLNLLNSIRKTLSMITLNRIKPKINQYLSQSQAAYREKRSTTDIIWAHRFLIAKVMLYQKQKIYITGLDMSSAFDTIDREELMTVLEGVIDEDELRMCRLLLSDTKLKLRFADHTEEVFESNKGSPQGDAISGIFFNIAFENALRDLRATINNQNIHIEHSYTQKNNIPEELIYADDSNFPAEDKHINNVIQRIANEILGKHSLKVNDDKWEKTQIIRSTDQNEEK